MSKITVVLCLFCLLALPTEVLADGKFFAEPYAADPSIPRQSMIAGFRDGKETLIVESTMAASKGESFAWVIPLPSIPERMEEANRFVMGSMRELRPKIVDAKANPFRLLGFLMIGIVALHVAFYIQKRNFRSARIAVAVDSLVLFLLFGTDAACGRWSTYGPPTAGGYGYSSARELISAEVGNYDVSVLEADEAEDLDQWLEENEFRRMDAKSLSAAQQYVKEKWVFAVARLRREGQNLLTTHPLSFTFPAKAPVFPMRLTAAPGQATNVWLYLVADAPYRCEGFKTILSDRFMPKMMEPREIASSRPLAFETKALMANKSSFESTPMRTSEIRQTVIGSVVAQQFNYRNSNSRIELSRKEIIDLVGQGAWITAMHSELDEAAMSQDIHPVESPNRTPYILTWYTPSFALKVSLFAGAVLFSVGVLLAGWLIKDKGWFLIAAAALLLASVLLHGTVFETLPKPEKILQSSDYGYVP